MLVLGRLLLRQLADRNDNSFMKAHVYIISNQNNTVLYTGVTSALKERINKHKTKKYPRSFAARYNIDKLVYFEEYDGMNVSFFLLPSSSNLIKYLQLCLTNIIFVKHNNF